VYHVCLQENEINLLLIYEMIPTPVEVILLLYFFLSTIVFLFSSARHYLQVPEELYEKAASKKTQLKLPQNRVV